MGKSYPEIDADLRAFIEAQHVFFVATAPSASDGHVNLSPKGLDCLRVLAPRTVAYLDRVGSGAETIAHLRENGRIVVMFCAFAGSARIVRLHGRGEVLEPQDAEFGALRPSFPGSANGRSIIRITVTRVSDSCGFGVPRYRYEGQRDELDQWAGLKGEGGLADYQRQKNRRSLDGLPALRWPEKEDAG